MHSKDKNFNWHLSRILFSSYYQGLQSFLLKIIKFSRLILFKNNRILLFYLQFIIAKNLTGLNKAVQEGKKEIKRLKNNIRDETNQKEKINLINKLEDAQIRLFANKNATRIIKTIIDGIAWRIMNYDRPILRLMASNRITGYFDMNEEGCKGVIKAAKAIIWSRKSKVIINDLSNFLRIGDLTEISKYGILIHECKGKGTKIRNIFTLLRDMKKTSNIGKQSERILKIQTAISHKRIYVSRTHSVQIKDINVPFMNYLNDVRKIIIRSKKGGFHSKKITDYLVVSCLDLIKGVQLIRNKKVKDWTDFKSAEDWEKTDFILAFSNTDTFYKNEDYFIPNMTPYSIFPYSSKICLELLCGRLILTARLNISKIYQLFQDNGWKVHGISENEFINREQKISLYPDINEAYNYDETLCVLNRGSFNLCIPATLVFRIGMDFMSAETILLEAEQIYKEAIPFKDGMSAINISDERKIWR